MSLVFAAITPNSIATLDGVGQSPNIEKSRAALKELEGELYVMQPDTIIVVSAHAPIAKETFLINLANEYSVNFQEFNPNLKKIKFACDIELVSKMREYADYNSSSYGTTNIISQTSIDFGAAVPLYHLTQHLPKVKIVPISPSLLSAAQHYKFAHVIRHVTSESNKRIAIIASTELASTPETDQITNPQAITFDTITMELIKKGELKNILEINNTLIADAQAQNCQKVLAMLFGAFNEMKINGTILSYERLNGLGLLVAQFNLI